MRGQMTKQSRIMSLVESCTNVAVGYGVAVAASMIVLPVFGVHLSLSDNLIIGGIFTVISIVRSFALRRAFEAIRVRKAHQLRQLWPDPDPLFLGLDQISDNIVRMAPVTDRSVRQRGSASHDQNKPWWANSEHGRGSP